MYKFVTCVRVVIVQYEVVHIIVPYMANALYFDVQRTIHILTGTVRHS